MAIVLVAYIAEKLCSFDVGKSTRSSSHTVKVLMAEDPVAILDGSIFLKFMDDGDFHGFAPAGQVQGLPWYPSEIKSPLLKHGSCCA